MARSGWASAIGKLGGVVDVALEHGVGALGDLLGTAREDLSEFREGHKQQRIGRERVVTEPIIARIAAGEWDEVDKLLHGYTTAELRRVRRQSLRMHEAILDAGGPDAGHRLTKEIAAELKRRENALGIPRRSALTTKDGE